MAAREMGKVQADQMVAYILLFLAARQINSFTRSLPLGDQIIYEACRLYGVQTT